MLQFSLLEIIRGRVRYILFWLLLIPVLLSAQQLPLLSNFGEYQGILNPSTVQYEHYYDDYEWSFSSSYRDQWNKVPNSPQTQLLSGSYVSNLNRLFDVLVGGAIINDRVGHFATTGIYGRVASIYNFSGAYSRHNKGGFSIGLLAGAVQYRLDTKSLRSADGSEDPRLSQGLNSIRPDIGIGVSVYKMYKRGKWKDYFYGGLAFSQLLPQRLEYRSDEDGAYSFKRIPHLNVNASYYLTTGDVTHLEFSGWLRVVSNIPPSASFLIKYKMLEFVWLGVGTGTQGIVHAEVGLHLDTYKSSYRRYKLVFAFNPVNPAYLAQFGDTYEITIKYLIDNY